ncbi:MAG: hypothetical protein M0P73_10190 [Syntrophobacterales bacterium]|jgi:hypothetical protein|nr:hypothetical protein [Syntrophobacterales bacterium]
MKISLWIVGFLAMACVCACSSPLEQYGMRGGRGQGFRVCPYQCSAPANAQCRSAAITGKITKIVVEKFAEDMEPGIAFNVIEADGNQVHVHVGPLRFMEKRESDFKVGDTVTIEGLCYHRDGKHYLIAAKMTHNDHTLNLRDSQGRPYWEDNSATY